MRFDVSAHQLVSSYQIKAARALLDWSQDDLARACGLSIATIRKLELGHISPRHSTTHTIRESFERGGLEFIDPDGVRRCREDITVYEGMNAASDFLEDICQTIKKKSGEIAIVEGAEGILFSSEHMDERFLQFEQIIRANGSVVVKCLLTDPSVIPYSSALLDVRSISKNYVDPLPLCVYGDKCAIIISGAGLYPKIIVVRSILASRAALRQFYSMWEMASPFFAKGINKHEARIAI